MSNNLINAINEFLENKDEEINQQRNAIVQIYNQLQYLIDKINALEEKITNEEGNISNRLDIICNLLSSGVMQNCVERKMEKHPDAPTHSVKTHPIFTEKSSQVVENSYIEASKKNVSEFSMTTSLTEDETVNRDTDIKGENNVKKEPIAIEEEPTRESIGKDKKNLRNAFSIGDKFLFQRELFNGNGELLQKTLSKFEKMNGIEEVNAYIEKHFNWDVSTEAYRLFNNALTKWFSL